MKLYCMRRQIRAYVADHARWGRHDEPDRAVTMRLFIEAIFDGACVDGGRFLFIDGGAPAQAPLTRMFEKFFSSRYAHPPESSQPSPMVCDQIAEERNLLEFHYADMMEVQVDRRNHVRATLVAASPA